MSEREPVPEQGYPGMRHPSYDHLVPAPEVFFAESAWRFDLVAAVPSNREESYLDDYLQADPYDTVVLASRKAAAPAAYVGPRREHWWRVLVDDYGRAIGPPVGYVFDFDDENDHTPMPKIDPDLQHREDMR